MKGEYFREKGRKLAGIFYFPFSPTNCTRHPPALVESRLQVLSLLPIVCFWRCLYVVTRKFVYCRVADNCRSAGTWKCLPARTHRPGRRRSFAGNNHKEPLPAATWLMFQVKWKRLSMIARSD